VAEPPHSTAERIGGGVRGRLGSVSTQAIRNVLITCRTGENRHLVCRGAGRSPT
jgi:hypothetical protein